MDNDHSHPYRYKHMEHIYKRLEHIYRYKHLEHIYKRLEHIYSFSVPLQTFLPHEKDENPNPEPDVTSQPARWIESNHVESNSAATLMFRFRLS